MDGANAKKQAIDLELWVDIVGYEGLYQISNFGNVKRLASWHCRKDRLLRFNVIRGYHIVKLSKLAVKTNFSVHRLVALHFLMQSSPDLVVNHKDSDPSNNNVSNLEWVSQKENVNHSLTNGFRIGIRGERNWNSKLTDAQMNTIQFMCKELGYPQALLANEYGVIQQSISRRMKTLCK